MRSRSPRISPASRKPACAPTGCRRCGHGTCREKRRSPTKCAAGSRSSRQAKRCPARRALPPASDGTAPSAGMANSAVGVGRQVLRFDHSRAEMPQPQGPAKMNAPMHSADVKTFDISDFRLRSGIVMPAVTIAYRTLGVLAPTRDNVVLVTHGNTSGPQRIDPGGPTGEGSWSELVGPGKAVDTNRFLF